MVSKLYRSNLVLIRRVEVDPDGKLGADYVTVGLLRYGRNGTRCTHWRIVSQSVPMTEKEAQRRINHATL